MPGMRLRRMILCDASSNIATMGYLGLRTFMGQTNYDNKLQVKESTCHHTRYQSSSPQCQDTRISERIAITLVHIYTKLPSIAVLQ